MARQAPSAKYYFSGADNAPVYVEPALQSIGRSDMTIIVPFDDPTTIKQIQSGGNIAVVAANTERIAFEVVDVLAAHEAKGTAIPATYPDDDLKVKMVDKSDVGNGSPAFPIKDEVAAFTKKWASEYGGS
jgi:hypothetical protein